MKLKNLYNLPSMARLRDSLGGAQAQIEHKLRQMDAASTGVVLARNFTYVDPTIFEKKFPELVFLNSGFDVRNEGGYAKKIQSLRRNVVGGYKGVNDTSKDKGRISITAEDSTISVHSFEASSDWNLDQIREAELQGINLVNDLIGAHDLVYKRTIDEIIAVGDSSVGIDEGLLNNSSFLTHAAGGAAASLTGVQLYQEIADIINFQWNAVQNTPEYMADNVVMPYSVMNECTSKQISADGYNTDNVLTALKKNFPTITFRASFRCDNAILVSEVPKNSTVAYCSNPQAACIRIPTPFELSEVYQMRGFSWGVDSKFRIGGFDLLESTSGYILTGL